VQEKSSPRGHTPENGYVADLAPSLTKPDFNTEIEALHTQLANANAELVNLREQQKLLVKAKETIVKKDSEIRRLESQFASRTKEMTTQISALKENLTEKETQISSTRVQISSKQIENMALTGRLTAAESKLQASTEILDRVKQESRSALGDKAREIMKLNEELKSAGMYAERLRAEKEEIDLVNKDKEKELQGLREFIIKDCENSSVLRGVHVDTETKVEEDLTKVVEDLKAAREQLRVHTEAEAKAQSDLKKSYRGLESNM